MDEVLKERIDVSGYVCVAPWSMLFIDPDGQARMCNAYSEGKLGSIKDRSLKELWNNKAAQNFRRSALAKKELSSSCLKYASCIWPLMDDF
jgi:radical SAM protein with 4Fe4S-binding SPASM domain